MHKNHSLNKLADKKNYTERILNKTNPNLRHIAHILTFKVNRLRKAKHLYYCQHDFMP